jgi:hypothetical protein
MGTIYPFSDVKQRMTPSHKSTQITPELDFSLHRFCSCFVAAEDISAEN